MATKWTEEQLRAINTRGENLLVAAAAGSGKTAVLVERIIKMITDKNNPVDIDRLLVVTFTSAVASEMRERIGEAISKELESNPNSTVLAKQLTLLSGASITTMHSFCLDVIKNNFHELDLDPGFRIGDATECVILQNEIINDVFEDKYNEGDTSFLDLVEAYGSSKDDFKLKELVLQIYSFAMSGPWPEQWLKEKSEDFNVSTKEDLNNSNWVKIIQENINLQLESIYNSYKNVSRVCYQVEGMDKYIENVEDDLQIISKLRQNCSQGLEETLLDLNSIKFGKLKTVKKNEIQDVDSQEMFKSSRDQMKKDIAKISSGLNGISIEQLLEQTQSLYPFMRTLSSLVLDFNEAYKDKKKERNMIDFNDMEHICLQILTSLDEEGNIVPSKVALNYREKFEEVFVDEYQDSNNVQETIIDMVSRKYCDVPNVFMVGDVKQSIYRFRQAKPELFIDKYNTYKLDEGDNRKIQLYKNFRSRKEVIDGVNYIFKELMSKTVGELEYSDDEALNLGANYRESEDEDIILGGAIELNIIDKNYEESAEDAVEEIEEINNVIMEGRIVARKIKELMSSKDGKTFKVLDKETGEYRPVMYKDIVILLRATKNWAESILDELGEEGIPVYSDTGTGYFESIEIRTIISLLKVIDNPMQDVPVLALMRSPIAGFSAEEISDVRLVNKEKYFYENIKYISEEDYDNRGTVYSKELIDKCKYLIERIEIWRNKSIYMAIDEFIWHLYMDTAYYGYVGAMPNGVFRQANLKILFQRAKQFEKTSFKGLFNFINFINKLTKSSGDMGSAQMLGENEDVVRIMSIHKSKGLEFPVVFLCGMGKSFNLMDLNKNMVYHDELGFGPDFVDIEKRFSIGTLAKESIKKKMKLETLSEEMRILYVACTRAKEKLIMTGTVTNIEKSAERWLSSSSLEKDYILPSEVLKCRSYLDWIGMALCHHNDGTVIREIAGGSNEISKNDESKWKINLWNKGDLINKLGLESIEEEKYETIITDTKSLNSLVSDEINRRLSYKYPLKSSTTLKSNISVSDLKRRHSEENYNTEEIYREKVVTTPKFLQEKRGLTPSEKGTAVHFVMKKIDLNRVSSINDIKEQLQELYEGEYILNEELKAINPYKIFNFFQSDLGRKILELNKNGGKIYREVPFYTEISSLEIDKTLEEDKYRDEKVRLQGIIDCFFEYDGDIILLDYKTDYVKKGDENNLKERYKKQLEYYSQAIFKMTGKNVKYKYLYSFSLEKEVLL